MPALTDTTMPAPEAASPELKARQRRRTFNARDKLRILAELDGADTSGATGAIVSIRREPQAGSRERLRGSQAAIVAVAGGG